MNLYSLTFLYLFLPFSLLLYYFVPRRAKNAALVLISLAFYTLAQPKYLPLMVGSVVFDYVLCRLMEHWDEKPARRRVLIAVILAKNVLLVALLSHFSQNREVWRPLGVMIYALTSLGYAVDVYRYDAPCEHNFINFSLFCILFFKLPAGPLVRWNDMEVQLKRRPEPTHAMLFEGATLYLRGLAKKVLIGNSMTMLYDQLASFSAQQQSVVSSWMLTASLALAVYFNLSSLCDMARGLGLLFGLELPRNFYYPYQSRSVTEFVGRFNITVTGFCNAYVSKPGRSESGAQLVYHIFIVTLLWGVWFGFHINYIIWSLYFVLFELLEELGLGTLLKKMPIFFTRIYTFAAVLMSFVIFSGNSVNQSIGYMKAMLGIGAPFSTDLGLYVASSNYILLLLAFLFCTSLCDMLLRWLRKKAPGKSFAVNLFLNAVLLLISTAFLLV